MDKRYTKRDYDDGSVYHALWCACYSIFKQLIFTFHNLSLFYENELKNDGLCKAER